MLTDITLSDLEYICLKMREIDKTEIYAIRPHDSPLQLAAEAYHMIRNMGRGRIAWANGRPAAVAAFTESWPGVWEVWMFGTDDFKAAAVPLLRWFRKEARDILANVNGHRLQCDSRADHTEAHRLIKAAGGIEEGLLRRYGKDGSDYIRFVWLNGENDAVLKPHYVRAA